MKKKKKSEKMCNNSNNIDGRWEALEGEEEMGETEQDVGREEEIKGRKDRDWTGSGLCIKEEEKKKKLSSFLK